MGGYLQFTLLQLFTGDKSFTHDCLHHSKWLTSESVEYLESKTGGLVNHNNLCVQFNKKSFKENVGVVLLKCSFSAGLKCRDNSMQYWYCQQQRWYVEGIISVVILLVWFWFQRHWYIADMTGVIMDHCAVNVFWYRESSKTVYVYKYTYWRLQPS